MANANLQGAHRLKQTLLHGATYAHHLAGSLHLGVQRIVGVGEFVKGEPGDLGDHIVQGRFKGSGGVGNRNLVQMHTHGNLGADPGNGIAAGLARQRRRAGDAGVDLDEEVLRGLGVERELHVAAALDLQLPNELQS